MADRGRPVAQRDVVDGELRPARRKVGARAVVEQPDVVVVLAQVLDEVPRHGVDRERARGVAVARSHDERALGAHLVTGQADLGAVRGRDVMDLGARQSRGPGGGGGLHLAFLSAFWPGLQGRTARRKSHGAARVGYKAGMQAAMDRLGSFISRRRKFVLGTWIVLLVVSLPFFAMQTKHLTAGGFEVPGSQSTFVADSIKQFPGVESEKLVFVFNNSKKDKAALDAAITKAVNSAKGVEGVAVIPQAEQAARAAGDQPIVLMALKVTGSADTTADAAAELRKNADILKGEDAAVPIHLVGQQALWAGMQDLSKEDLEKAEFAGFPDRKST